jgi:Protein of unknown function (DUF3551)
MHAASAQSPTSYPWCSRGGDGDNYNICYFTSKEQCQGTASGVAAFCFANPYYRPSLQASDEAVNAPRRPGGERNQLPGATSVPTLVEQSQLVGVGDGDFLMQIIMKQAIDGGFLEQAEAQNL